MAAPHMLATGPITGVIPTPDPILADDTLDVTPPFLEFATVEEAQAAAHAIEDELHVRGTHPAQQLHRQAQVAGDPDAEKVAAGHVADLEKRVKARAAARRKG